MRVVSASLVLSVFLFVGCVGPEVSYIGGGDRDLPQERAEELSVMEEEAEISTDMVSENLDALDAADPKPLEPEEEANPCDETERTKQCDGERLVICRGGLWVLEEDCVTTEGYCYESGDSASCVVCTGQEERCGDGRAWRCLNFTWAAKFDCSEQDKECEVLEGRAICVPCECDEGEKRCNLRGDGIEICSNECLWRPIKDCEQVTPVCESSENGEPVCLSLRCDPLCDYYEGEYCSIFGACERIVCEPCDTDADCPTTSPLCRIVAFRDSDFARICIPACSVEDSGCPGGYSCVFALEWCVPTEAKCDVERNRELTWCRGPYDTENCKSVDASTCLTNEMLSNPPSGICTSACQSDEQCWDGEHCFQDMLCVGDCTVEINGPGDCPDKLYCMDADGDSRAECFHYSFFLENGTQPEGAECSQGNQCQEGLICVGGALCANMRETLSPLQFSV